MGKAGIVGDVTGTGGVALGAGIDGGSVVYILIDLAAVAPEDAIGEEIAFAINTDAFPTGAVVGDGVIGNLSFGLLDFNAATIEGGITDD